MKEVTKLLGSSSTLDGIIKIIAEYYCCSPENISKGGQYLKGVRRVWKKEKCMNTRIVEKKNRFRFELVL